MQPHSFWVLHSKEVCILNISFSVYILFNKMLLYYAAVFANFQSACVPGLGEIHLYIWIRFKLSFGYPMYNFLENLHYFLEIVLIFSWLALQYSMSRLIQSVVLLLEDLSYHNILLPKSFCLSEIQGRRSSERPWKSACNFHHYFLEYNFWPMFSWDLCFLHLKLHQSTPWFFEKRGNGVANLAECCSGIQLDLASWTSRSSLWC